MRRSGILFLAVAAAAALAAARGATPAPVAEACRSGADRPAAGDVSNDREPVSHRPTVEASFAAESYRAGTTATLVLFDAARNVTVRLYRVGDGRGRLRTRDAMRGDAVGGVHRVGRVVEGSRIRLRLGAGWRSGLYFARLSAPPNRVGYAPFVLAPRRLGEHRVAVVLPTQSWQAYNFRDDDRDGDADTWYGSATARARLIRPHENRGVPGHYRQYDEPFLRWIARNGYAVDFLSDRELKHTTGARLARAYELLVFEGHHEYVTRREFDAVTEFRDRGGNLIFLSGNNFFRKVTVDDGVMTLVGRWRNLGRPEAALVGVQWFLGCASPGSSGRPWTIRNTPASRWIFRGTGLGPRSQFSSGGIEADAVAPSSPPGTQIVAAIEDVFGTGKDAHMTYYETAAGAKVFAAGAFTLAGAIWQPPVRRVVANLIAALSRLDARGGIEAAAAP
ncbi:MAG: N,N-dimethylformamidase beta subunit family domain-containing protein [Gaiellaceae bacterium]